jgi:DNA-directed RNA polymerase specialized sigma24 family protein
MSRRVARLRDPAGVPVDRDRRGARLDDALQAPIAAQSHDTKPDDALPAPLVWTFDGPFERCLADLEDTLRRAIVLIGDAARIALLIDLSLPAVKARVDAGDRLQPAWGRFLDRLARYGLPAQPRVRHLRAAGPLATLVIAYRH